LALTLHYNAAGPSLLYEGPTEDEMSARVAGAVMFKEMGSCGSASDLRAMSC